MPLEKTTASTNQQHTGYSKSCTCCCCCFFLNFAAIWMYNLASRIKHVCAIALRLHTSKAFLRIYNTSGHTVDAPFEQQQQQRKKVRLKFRQTWTCSNGFFVVGVHNWYEIISCFRSSSKVCIASRVLFRDAYTRLLIVSDLRSLCCLCASWINQSVCVCVRECSKRFFCLILLHVYTLFDLFCFHATHTNTHYIKKILAQMRRDKNWKMEKIKLWINNTHTHTPKQNQICSGKNRQRGRKRESEQMNMANRWCNMLEQYQVRKNRKNTRKHTDTQTDNKNKTRQQKKAESCFTSHTSRAHTRSHIIFFCFFSTQTHTFWCDKLFHQELCLS